MASILGMGGWEDDLGLAGRLVAVLPTEAVSLESLWVGSCASVCVRVRACVRETVCVCAACSWHPQGSWQTL